MRRGAAVGIPPLLHGHLRRWRSRRRARGQLALRLALRGAGCGAAPRIEHGIDELEHRTLIGGRELLDAAEPLEQPRGLRRGPLADGRHAEQLIGGDRKGARQIDEHGARGLGVVGLVLGNDAIGDADAQRQFPL
jgi:hypothetical protein